MPKKKDNNHYISEFQLRKFPAEPPKNKPGRYFVWVYSQEAMPDCQNVKRVGSSYQFYGAEDDSLEEAFADQESKYGKVYRQIEEDPSSVAKLGDELSDLIWLFGLRTRAMRERMRASITQLMSEATGSVYRNSARSYFRRAIEEAIDSRVDELLSEMNVFQRLEAKRNPEFQRRIASVRSAALNALENGHVSELVASGFRMVMNLSATSPTLDEKHNEILSKFIASGGRCPDQIRPDTWVPIVDHSGRFVLGDSGAFAVGLSGAVEPFVGIGRNWADVYVPISPTIVVVGRSSGSSGTLSAEAIVDATIETSLEHVFSDSYSQALETKARQGIGRLTGMVPPDAVRDIVSSVWEKPA